MSRSKPRRGGAARPDTGGTSREQDEQAGRSVPDLQRPGEGDQAGGGPDHGDPWYPGRPDRLRRNRIV
jgi:hypothetical protein